MADVKKLAYESLKREFGEEPGYFYPSSFQNLPALSYYEIYERGASFADDRMYTADSQVMVDLYAETIPQLTLWGKRADDAMASAGFIKVNSVDLYDNEAQCYHRAQRYKIVIGVD